MLDALSRIRRYPRDTRLGRPVKQFDGLSRQRALRIIHRVSRKASSLAEGRHFRAPVGARPDRFQKASSTCRFISRFVVMYRLVVLTEA